MKAFSKDKEQLYFKKQKSGRKKKWTHYEKIHGKCLHMWSLILFAVIELHSRPSLWGHSSFLHPPSQKKNCPCAFSETSWKNSFVSSLYLTWPDWGMGLRMHTSNTPYNLQLAYTQVDHAHKHSSEYSHVSIVGYARISSLPVNCDNTGDKQHEQKPEPISEFLFYFYWELGHM